MTPGFVQSQAISLPIEFSTASDTSTIVIGTHPDASENFDINIDVFAPPSPPEKLLNVWSTINNENYREDYRDTTGVEKLFHVTFETDAGSAIIARWDPAILTGNRIFEITDDDTGLLFGPIDMTASNSFDVSSAGGLLDNGMRIRMAPGIETGVTTEQDLSLPDVLVLEQNFPNPFKFGTEIRFNTVEAAETRLAVYNILGKEIAVLVDGMVVPGRHAVSWEAVGLPDGIYFYRLTMGSAVRTNQMMLIR